MNIYGLNVSEAWICADRTNTDFLDCEIKLIIQKRFYYVSGISQTTFHNRKKIKWEKNYLQEQ